MFSAFRNTAIGAVALALVSLPAHAFVSYTVENPTVNFVLFTYDSPTFITSDITVPVSSLAYFAPPPLNFITQVEFIVSSTDNSKFLGQPEIIVDQSSGGPPQTFTGTELRWFPDGTFTQYGVTKGLGTGCGCATDSFGYPNSELVVAAPEPSAIRTFGAGVLGLIALGKLRRRA
jgi:hypothetical protein